MLELFNEDRLAYPHFPQLFDIPRLMTHLRRKQLSKDTDALFTVNVGPSFYHCSMHESFAALIVLPLDRVSNYRGPWVVQGGYPALKVKDHIDAGFKNPELHGF